MPRLFSKELASGPDVPIVLSHALGLDHSMWATTAAIWRGQRPVLAYDHRGHGLSAVPPGPYTMRNLVDDAEALVTEWGRGPVIWIGLSLGGMVGQGLAIRRPDLVRALVLTHTTSQYPPEAQEAWAQRIKAVSEGGMATVVELVLQRYLTEHTRRANPGLESELSDRILRTDPAGYVASCSAIANVQWLEDLHLIRCPTLILAGEHDAGATPAMARQMHERIPASQMHVLHDASHLSPLETPDAFRESLRKFLAAA